MGLDAKRDDVTQQVKDCHDEVERATLTIIPAAERLRQAAAGMQEEVAALKNESMQRRQRRASTPRAKAVR